MNVFLRSDEFDVWLAALKDKSGRARIIHRIRAAEHGNFGDCQPVGEGVSEMRIHFGPGYRVYFTRRCDAMRFIYCYWEELNRPRNATSNARLKWRERLTSSEHAIRSKYDQVSSI